MQKPEKDLMNNPPEKVILMYQSVVDLINEGTDINNIKVADITKRAGIGKGTAYEYFSTKEEIITKALLYEMTKSMMFMREVAYSEVSFEQKIKKLLDYGAEHYHEGRTFFQLLKIVSGAYDISDSLKQEFWKMKEENICKQFLVLQDVVIETGVKENIIKESDTMRQRTVVNSQIIAFLLCLAHSQKNDTGMTPEEIKQFIYESIIKLLG